MEHKNSQLEIFAYAVIIFEVIFAVNHINGGEILFKEINILIGIPLIIFVPGALVLLYLNSWSTLDRIEFLLFSLGLSLIILTSLGLLLSVVGEFAGMKSPLQTFPLILAHGITTCFLAIICISKEDHPALHSDFTIFNRRIIKLNLVIFSILPLTIVSVFLIERSLIILALFLLLIISLIPLMLVRIELPRSSEILLIWVISISLLYHTALYGPPVDGSAIAALIFQDGNWLKYINSPNSFKGKAALLPNTLLYPALAKLLGVKISRQFEIINPLIISFIPLVIYSIYNKIVEHDIALLSIFCYMFSFPFFVLYPRGGRISTPILFLALLILVGFSNLRRGLQHWLTILFLFMALVSHYGTAFLIMFIFIGYAITTEIWGKISLYYQNMQPPKTAISLTSSAMITTFTVSWYMYTSPETSFKSLAIHLYMGIVSVVTHSFGGSAAQTAKESYSSTSVIMSKYLFIFIVGVCGISFLLILLKILFFGEYQIPIDYILLSLFFFGLLPASFTNAGAGFNIARVLMITLLPTSVYFGLFFQHLPKVNNLISRNVAMISLSVILCVFFLLNSGVIAETLTHDYGPSTTVSEPDFHQKRILLFGSKQPDA